MSFDVARIRQDFPVLAECINNKPLVYLDSANSSQKPHHVISAMSQFMEHAYGPTNRSAYQLAAHATDLYEGARAKVAKFINAKSPSEVVFTKNATESLNLIVRSWATANMSAGDVVVLTHMEHHANIVPWHMLAAEKGIVLRWVPLTADGLLDLSQLDQLLTGAKAFSFTAMSNVLGTINPVKELIDAAHRHGAIAIVDGCQSVPHMPTDVQALGADFLAFSSHKMVGPTGIGMLWGREELLDAMPPFLGGGIGMNAVRQHEMDITRYALDTLTHRFGDDIVIHGSRNVELRGATISFAYRDVHPHDVSQVLDQHNVCVRAGHHCAKPLMKLLGSNATVRASFYLYNTNSEVDALCDALSEAGDFFTL